MNQKIDKKQVNRLTDMISNRIEEIRQYWSVGTPLSGVEKADRIADIMANITDILVQLDKEMNFNSSERLEVVNKVLIYYTKHYVIKLASVPIIGNIIMAFAKRKIKILSVVLVRYLDKIIWDDTHVSSNGLKDKENGL